MKNGTWSSTITVLFTIGPYAIWTAFGAQLPTSLRSDFIRCPIESCGVTEILSGRAGFQAQPSITPNTYFISGAAKLKAPMMSPRCSFALNPEGGQPTGYNPEGIGQTGCTGSYRAQRIGGTTRRSSCRLSSEPDRNFGCLPGDGQPWSDLVQLSAGTFEPGCARSSHPDRTKSLVRRSRLSLCRKGA